MNGTETDFDKYMRLWRRTLDMQKSGMDDELVDSMHSQMDDLWMRMTEHSRKRVNERCSRHWTGDK